jgi:hydrogenase expression/formation protein HypC
MCLGVPGRLVERVEPIGGLDYGVVEFGGLRRRVCVACVPEAATGDYVIVHAGIAISRLDPAEAERILRHLEEIGELLEGPDS